MAFVVAVLPLLCEQFAPVALVVAVLPSLCEQSAPVALVVAVLLSLCEQFAPVAPRSECAVTRVSQCACNTSSGAAVVARWRFSISGRL